MADSNWKKISTFSVGHVPVEVYKSSKTGMQVCMANVEGPLVNAHVVVSTECESDDGLPHTLEHLVFLGSEKFPYKGVLDKVANRAFATGTNAYTDVHHTAYTLTTAGCEGLLSLLPSNVSSDTLTTAGCEGLLSLLPVFLDHIVFPTITETGFTTEVYHVDGTGTDAGVVFCEMQAIANEVLILEGS
ncbi:hypothetical protein T484DRAFT_1762021 [Baffinella frigidus]|nr:hypothetical protein T484DRAFT_1762021 [Cryptophyta sp. CCMP2293]